MSEAPWRRRFRAARVSLPGWARQRPDRAVYASNVSGKWELYTWDLASDTHRQVTDRDEGTLRGTIEPSGEWVWWFDDDKGNEFGRWVVQPFGADHTEAVPLAPDHLAPAYSAGLAIGEGFAVVGRAVDERTTFHLVDDSGDVTLLYEHEEDAHVGGLSRDGTMLAFTHSEAGDSRHPDLRIVDMSGNALADLSDGPGMALWPMGWSRVPGDQRLLVLHERRDLPRPMVWNAATGEEVELDLDLPGEVDASWYPDGSALLLSHDHRGRTELYRYDLTAHTLERIPTEPGTIGSALVRPDGELWYSWTSASEPPQVRAGDRLLLRPPGEPAPPGAPYDDLDVDGIHGFVARPEGEGPFPTFFFVHGGPESHDVDAFAPEPQAWVDHGYAVVLVNYRGSTGYGKAWRDAIEGNPGLTELDDIGRVHEWAVSSGLADPARVVLAGHSWGGYLTLLGLGRQPERWALGIAGVPVADYVAAYEDEMEPLKAFDRALFGGSPDDIPDAYVERSPITYAEAVGVPVMILAGENDPRCPIRQIEHYLARLGELGKVYETYRYDAGHGSLVIEERIRQVEAMLDFAARHLGTSPPA
ncbi:MAG TPA: alpha/beta fold hydrolase [Acidimicrobiia bacterium]|nr:alpha/beta fold hydrolase [Acidimicrobiia bacterium]